MDKKEYGLYASAEELRIVNEALHAQMQSLASIVDQELERFHAPNQQTLDDMTTLSSDLLTGLRFMMSISKVLTEDADKDSEGGTECHTLLSEKETGTDCPPCGLADNVLGYT